MTTVLGCADRACHAGPDIAAAVAAVQSSEAVVLCMGLDGSLEGEGMDRMDIRLPPGQRALISGVVEASGPRPVVLVLFNGGTVALDDAVLGAPVAIVEAFYPGASGGTAVAESIYGLSNRWGKLPMTYYKCAQHWESRGERRDVFGGFGGSDTTHPPPWDPPSPHPPPRK